MSSCSISQRGPIQQHLEVSLAGLCKPQPITRYNFTISNLHGPRTDICVQLALSPAGDTAINSARKPPGLWLCCIFPALIEPSTDNQGPTEDFSQAQNFSRLEVKYGLWFAQNKMLETREKAKHQSPQYYLHHWSRLNLPQLVESLQKCIEEYPVPKVTFMQPDTSSPHSQYARETQEAISTYT